MPVDPIDAMVQSRGHAAQREHANGNLTRLWNSCCSRSASSLDIPIQGIPLSVMGIRKIASAKDSK